MLVALAGNPNCGKTTLFNALTDSRLYVGNWPGVTVERMEASATGLAGVTVCDLPGLYSLNALTLEERVSEAFLNAHEADVVLGVVDATCPQRGLYLTTQLLEAGLPVIVVMNLIDEAKKRGQVPDMRALEAGLGARVIPVSAKTGEGLGELREALKSRPLAPANRPKPGRETPVEAATRRYALIERLLGAPVERAEDASQRIDRVLIHRLLAYPALLCAFGLMFYAAFGPLGSGMARALEAAISEGCAPALASLLADAPAWLRSLALNGLLAGVGGVTAFLPQMLILFLFLALLEDSGYMARAAFIADRPMRLFGLTGRSVVPLLLGLGCTTAAVASARCVQSERDRQLTVALTPFVSCGAKLPIYAVFASAFAGAYAGLAIFCLYLTGLLAMTLSGALLRRAYGREGDGGYLMELPDYRVPSARGVLRRVLQRASDFLARAGTVIALASVVVWFLRYFTPDFRVAGNADSLLTFFGRALAPAFQPLGFGEWEKCASLLAGLAAKEALLSSLLVLYAAPDTGSLIAALPTRFTAASACAYIVFTLLYTPCFSALAAMRRELGGARRLALCAITQLCVAYAFSFAACHLARAVLAM